MDSHDEIRQFLTSRRAKIKPRDAGLPEYGGSRRRVKGLRRHEVAMLAGVSVEYYAKLERGNLAGVSDSVLEAVAGALHLDGAEREHLRDLARTANQGAGTAPARRRRRPDPEVRPGVLRLLETITDGPAFVRNGRLDLLAVNDLARALYSPVFADPANLHNLARFRFLDPASGTFYPDWDESAGTTVNLLRTEAGRDPYNPDLTELIGELSTRSEEFRTRWARHDVRLHHTGSKRFHHPVVGELTLSFEAMPLPADPGLTLTAYHAEPGSPSHDAVRLLASWAASERMSDPRTAETADDTSV